MTLFSLLLCVLSVPVWPAGREAEMNGFYRFRADVSLGTVTGGLLRATAGYAYRAYVNGEFVGYGPARAAPGFFRVDEWPVKLSGGVNVVELEVAGYNCNNFYLPMQTPFLQAEVVVGGRVVAKTAADGEFRALTTGRVRKVPRFSYQRPFMEVYRLPHAADGPLALRALPAVRLLPREWAYPDFRVTDPFSPRSLERVVRDETVRTKSERYIVSTQGNYRYFPPGELEENPFYDIQRLKTVSRTAPPAAGRDGWYRLEPDEGLVFSGKGERAGFPMLKVRCRGPVTLYFTFDELLQDDGSVNPFRAETVGTVVWHLEAGEHALEGFEPVAFSCARVLAVGGGAEITAPRIRTYESPTASRASFRSSDPALERIFEAARRSYAANAVDCLTDCPIRERAGWLGDTFFTGRAGKWLTGSARNEELFLRNFLLAEKFDASSFEKTDLYAGLVPAVWPVDLMCSACFIPNWDFWFVLELEEFLQRGGDPELVKAFRPRVMGIVAWFDRHLNSDGLLEKLPGWVFVEWSRANKLVQDVNYPSNMMYAKMLDAVGRLYGKPELKERALRIRRTVRRQSLTDGGWYCDNAVRQPDGTLKLSGERTEVCQYYAFFTDVATKEDDALLWRRLVDEFGPNRTKWKEIWPANFIFGTCLRMELLSQDGRAAQIYREIRDYFLQMAEKTGTLWEHNSPQASCCHGFASIASEYLIRDVLGFRGLDPETGKPVVKRPEGLPLDWCRAVLPVSEERTVEVGW